MLLNCGVEENSWEYLGLQANQSSQSWRKSVLNIDWCWSFNTLATWCKSQPIERPWCWERSNVGGEGNNGVRWLDDISEWMDMSLSKLQGAGDGQGSLACYSPWGHKELDTTEQLKWTELRRGPTAPVLRGAGMCAHLWERLSLLLLQPAGWWFYPGGCGFTGKSLNINFLFPPERPHEWHRILTISTWFLTIQSLSGPEEAPAVTWLTKLMLTHFYIITVCCRGTVCSTVGWSLSHGTPVALLWWVTAK